SMSNNYWRTARADAFGWAIDGEHYFCAFRDAIDRAEHEIIIIGWDIDSRFELIRDDSDPRYPSPISKTLKSLAEEKPALSVYVLSWDFAIVYAMERELLPERSFGWKDRERLHFHLDDQHASGASHHQKIVIVDGVLAFSGGLDLTKDRWDTRRHAADDRRRVDPDGNAYRPFHDVQAIVTGDAARTLRELASSRWENATGEPLPALDDEGDAESIWPETLPVQATNVEVAIARTVGKSGGNGISEVEQSYLELIASAERSIYIENQYFTSDSIATALAERLAGDDPPEIVLVLPSETSGWLEQATMDILRNRGLARLREADTEGRLRVVSPTSKDLEDAPITVHAKIMIVDNRWLRIGSANLSGRSMGLDTECDLVVEHEDAATDFCADLLSEHMGAEFDEVRAGLTSDGLLATLAAFNDGDRWLETLDPDVDETEQAILEPVARIADLEKPIALTPSDTGEHGGDDVGDDEDDEMHTPVAGWAALGLIVIVVGIWIYLAAKGSGEDLNFSSLLDMLRDVASHPLAPYVAVPAIVLGSVVVAPITGMLAVCALLFDPWTASIVGITGTLAATAVNHWIGGHFGRVIAKRIPKRIIEKINRMAASSDVWSLAAVRLVPIAPFSVVNVLLGVSGVRLRDFLLGTLIAMGPAIVLLCMSVDRARAALAGESVFDPWIIVVIAAAGISVIGLRIWQKRR
ncbi:MAG: phospholipase D-like domain-containing protein, partial [Woeseiaceae bacterium]